MAASILDPALVQAYRLARYRVRGAHPLTLRPGHRNATLAAAHRRHRVDCSAYVTACNPLGEIAGPAANARRHAALRRELARRGLAHVEGAGEDPAGRWRPEPSYLVFGLRREDAKALGRSLAQNAIVWSGRDAVPRLVLLR